MIAERRKANLRKTDALLKKASEQIMKERQADNKQFAEMMGRRSATAVVVLIIFFMTIYATGKNAGIL